MLENRRSAIRTEIRAKINGVITLDDTFNIINISDTGVLINTPQKLVMDVIYYLKFSFLNNGDEVTLKLRAKAARVNLSRFDTTPSGENMPVYEAGLSFFNTSNDDVKKLKLLIAKKELGYTKQNM